MFTLDYLILLGMEIIMVGLVLYHVLTMDKKKSKASQTTLPSLKLPKGITWSKKDKPYN